MTDWVRGIDPLGPGAPGGGYVVIEELIPESQSGGHTDLATTATMAGFAIMMMLDVALG
jgi:zinc transporter ZupT